MGEPKSLMDSNTLAIVVSLTIILIGICIMFLKSKSGERNAT